METVTEKWKRILQSTVIAMAAVLIAAGPAPVYGAGGRTGGTAAEKTADRDAADSRKKTETKDETVPFEEAVESFYSSSGNMTDGEILESARKIRSDGDVLYSELGKDTSESVMAVMDAYEAAKADYIAAQINGEMASEQKRKEKESETVKAAGLEMSASGGICREWDRQSDYTRLMITEEASIREMIPRYQITACEYKKGVLKIDVDEWMTQGYGETNASDVENASAYSYSFSISLKQNSEGVWTPFSINGTDVNFTWRNAAAKDPELETEDAPAALYEVKSDYSPEVVAYAQIASDSPAAGTGVPASEGGDRLDVDSQGQTKQLTYEVDSNAVVVAGGTAQTQRAETDPEIHRTASLSTSSYSGYDAGKAIAYADRYWKHYNRRYVEYRGLDCCNFVSQCLYAGGMPQTSSWFPNSVPWINVPAAMKHFKQYGAYVTADNGSVRRGNPVYYDWQGDGVYDHTTICVGTNASGMPVVDGHTTNVFHVPWRMGSGGRRRTILLNSRASSSTASRSTWRTVNGKVYYIDKNGKTVKNKFLNIGGRRYYFNRSGARVTGFFKVSGKWYYASVKTGNLLRGWQWIGGNIYYFSYKNYARFQGGPKWIAGNTYYFSSKGIRRTGFIKYKGKWYYADKSGGKFVTGWKKISGNWYYFDPKTKVRAIGWKTIKGRKCYFNSKGVLKKGKHG